MVRPDGLNRFAMNGVYRTELTPLAFLERAADVFSNKTAVVYGDRQWTYADLADEVQRIAAAVRASGIEAGDRVAFLCPNIPEMLMAHYAVPLASAVLVAINTRLSPTEIHQILDHSGARLLVADTELLQPLSSIVSELATVDEIVAVDDTNLGVPHGATSWPEFLSRGSGDLLPWTVDDERRTISINYTSGTTGTPKGVMYTHRGAYLNALGEVIHSGHSPRSVYLWTLPMFHCNGWCTTWGVTAVGGRHVCLRRVDSAEIWHLIGDQGVTHLNAAPIVLVGLANGPAARPFPAEMTITTAGAPPSPTIIQAMEDLGARIVHVYGLTETYGPHTVCEWQEDVPGSGEARARFLARQGVAYVHADPIRVVDGDMADVPRDGTTMGEVVMRGNNVMSGYFDNEDATADAFRGGWFHSGDIAVWHPDGYIERSPGVCRGRRPERHMGRASQGVRRTQARRGGRPGVHHRTRAGTHRSLQGPRLGGPRRRVAEDVDRQDPEVRAARERVGRTRRPGLRRHRLRRDLGAATFATEARNISRRRPENAKQHYCIACGSCVGWAARLSRWGEKGAAWIPYVTPT